MAEVALASPPPPSNPAQVFSWTILAPFPVFSPLIPAISYLVLDGRVVGVHPLEQLSPRGDVGEGPGACCLQRQSRAIRSGRSGSSGSINNADDIDVAISLFRLRRLRPARVRHGAQQRPELRPHGIVQVGIEKERRRRRGGRVVVDDGFRFADADEVHQLGLGRGGGRPSSCSSSELAAAAAAAAGASGARGARSLRRWGLGAAAHVLEVVSFPLLSL